VFEHNLIEGVKYRAKKATEKTRREVIGVKTEVIRGVVPKTRTQRSLQRALGDLSPLTTAFPQTHFGTGGTIREVDPVFRPEDA